MNEPETETCAIASPTCRFAGSFLNLSRCYRCGAAVCRSPGCSKMQDTKMRNGDKGRARLCAKCTTGETR